MQHFVDYYINHIGLVVFTMLMLIMSACRATTPPLIEQPTATPFQYLVKVLDKNTLLPVANANVTIEVEQRVPLDIFTDSTGIARIIIKSNYMDRPGNLIVRAKDYVGYNRFITLNTGLPKEIRLEPLPADVDPITFVTPSPTDFVDETPIKRTSEPTSEPTVEPSAEPSPTVERKDPLVVNVSVESAETGEKIPGAKIDIKIIGEATIEYVATENGTVIITIDSSNVGKSAELVAVAPGFQSYVDIVDLVNTGMPSVIKLIPIGTVTSTPTIAPATIPPIIEPTRAPTEVPSPITGRLAIPLLIDGNLVVYITDMNGNILNQQPITQARQPDFSPDGSQLVVNGDGGPQDKLRLMDNFGNNQKEFGDSGLAGHSHPVWSPDGTQVMYDDNTVNNGWRILRRDLDSTVGPGEEIFAREGPIVGQNPMWTTGARFVFRGCQTWVGQGGECGLWVMEGQGGDPKRLSNNFNHIPTDVFGNTVVYVSNEAGGDDWNIYKININDGIVQQLTDHPAPDSLATISPNGSFVAFLSNRNGTLGVWVVGINGGVPQKMFEIPQNWGTVVQDGWAEEKLSWGK